MGYTFAEMKRQDLNVVSEISLVMAATLIDIKSRMLLPAPETEDEEEEESACGTGTAAFGVQDVQIVWHTSCVNRQMDAETWSFF